MKHFRSSKAYVRLQEAKQVVLFPDFDGTLVPLSGSPHLIQVPDTVHTTLRVLAAKPGYTVGIISGRNLEDLNSLLDVPPEVPIAGNHGLEWMIGGAYKMVELPEGYLDALEKLRKELALLANKSKGISVEWKTVSMSVHLRIPNDKRRRNARKSIVSAIARANTGKVFEVVADRTYVDIRPGIAWTKAEVIGHFMKELHIDETDTLFVYIGDDKTDEDVFRAYRKAITIHVGRATKSYAKYYLKHVPDVHEVLETIAAGVVH